MKFSQEFSSDAYRIHAYSEQGVKVICPLSEENQGLASREKQLTQSFIVGNGRLGENWGPKHMEELSAADFAEIETYEPQVVLLGVGKRLRFPDAALYRELLTKGIGVEVMDSSAACRTYNILVNEGRNVVAAIILD